MNVRVLREVSLGGKVSLSSWYGADIRRLLALFLILLLLGGTVSASEQDANRITGELLDRHLPFGIIMDPIFEAPDSMQIHTYTRCGDSAIWTGFYLASEAYRYAVTKSPEAMNNAWRALTGIRRLMYVTGTSVLARCAFPVTWEHAADLIIQEQHNGIYQGNYNSEAYYWVGNTSRDQYLGVFFGLVTAFDMIGDPNMNATIADITWKLLDNLEQNGWTPRMPDGSHSTSFTLRPDQHLNLMAIGRHILPERFGSDYSSYATFHFFEVPAPIALEVLDVINSYFKFNLDTIALVNLIRLENNPTRRAVYQKAYDILRNTTDGHQNAFFNMMDYVLAGPNAQRDQDTVTFLELWLKRPRRDFRVDLRQPQYADRVQVCLDYACAPIPVDLRVPTDFLWQRNPFQLSGGGDGFIESAGIDYLLPYWMARYYGILGPDPPPRSGANGEPGGRRAIPKR